VQGLGDDQIYLPGVPQNEASALLIFYNDSVTEKVTNHSSLKNCYQGRDYNDLLQSRAQR